MNYFDAKKNFEFRSQEFGLTITEFGLYFYLIMIADNLHWGSNFKRNNSKICGDLNISKKALQSYRDKLKLAGLIDYESRKGSSNVTYFILSKDEEPTPEPIPKKSQVRAEVRGEVRAEVRGEVRANIIKTKTKTKNTIKDDINISSKSDENPEPKEPEKEQIKNWKNDFSIYLEECKDAFSEKYHDEDFIAEREKFFPGVDIRKTMEKAFVDFWGTEAGWENKRKQRKLQKINWTMTIKNAISMNKVYKKPSNDRHTEIQSSHKVTGSNYQTTL